MSVIRRNYHEQNLQILGDTLWNLVARRPTALPDFVIYKNKQPRPKICPHVS